LLNTQPELLFRPCVGKTDFFKGNQIVKVTNFQFAEFIEDIVHCLLNILDFTDARIQMTKQGSSV
jgi:hypothetical protein